MTNPMPSSACIEQAGPWRTAATLEVRGDGYLMDAIRNLARSGRGHSAPLDLAHSRLVQSQLYTEHAALASTHADSVTPQYHEQANLRVPLQRSTQTTAPPPPRNAWSRQSPARATDRQPLDGTDQTASPLSTSSHTSNSHQSMGSQDIRFAGTTPARQTPSSQDPPNSFNNQHSTMAD
jgi:hypothetical protein